MLTKKDFQETNAWITTNLTVNEYMNNETPKIRPSDDCIQEFASYTNNDTSIAKLYFNAFCGLCGDAIKTKSEIGISLKYLQDKILCKQCFCKECKFTEEEYIQRIDALKQWGCTLV